MLLAPPGTVDVHTKIKAAYTRIPQPHLGKCRFDGMLNAATPAKIDQTYFSCIAKEFIEVRIHGRKFFGGILGDQGLRLSIEIDELWIVSQIGNKKSLVRFKAMGAL